MNAQELREKNAEQLQEELYGLLREQFNLRMQKGTGQLSQNHRLRQVRRSIARIYTIMGEVKRTDKTS